MDAEITTAEITTALRVLDGTFGLTRAARVVRVAEALNIDFGRASRVVDMSSHPSTADLRGS